MKTFDELWSEIEERLTKQNIVIVQDKEELRHVFGLVAGSKSYLEVGTAEGNSLYVLAHALDPNAKITFVDFGEEHTAQPRREVLARIPQSARNITPIMGNSHAGESIRLAWHDNYDVVMIDAGHTYEDVIADAAAYGPKALKYIIFHDVMLPEVNRAFEWYARQIQRKSYRFVNSRTYGYGVIEL